MSDTRLSRLQGPEQTASAPQTWLSSKGNPHSQATSKQAGTLLSPAERYPPGIRDQVHYHKCDSAPALWASCCSHGLAHMRADGLVATESPEGFMLSAARANLCGRSLQGVQCRAFACARSHAVCGHTRCVGARACASALVCAAALTGTGSPHAALQQSGAGCSCHSHPQRALSRARMRTRRAVQQAHTARILTKD